MAELIRCSWCLSEPLYIEYHDTEWGVPQHDDRMLFEMLNLEGAQAGLSWITILRKREAYREVFAGFEAERLIHFTDTQLQDLMQDERIIRNRLKISAVRSNARAFLEVRAAFGSFDRYIWQFTEGRTLQNRPSSLQQVEASTPESVAMSKDLKKKGFRFVGPTICYAFMQACGMVNDHIVDCFRHAELASPD